MYFGSTIPQVKTPWYEGAIEVETRMYTESQAQRFNVVGTSYYANGTQNHPSEWTLCRQAIILGDDDQENPNSTRKTVYLGRGISSHTIFLGTLELAVTPPIHMCCTVEWISLQRNLMTFVKVFCKKLNLVLQSAMARRYSTGTDQQELIASLFYWPRVEPYPPTAVRYDQALMMSAIAEGCVSFQVEWTYDEGVGEATDANHVWYSGYQFDDLTVSPWWGSAYTYSIGGQSDEYNIGFNRLTDFTYDAINGVTNDVVPVSINPSLIEPVFNNTDTAGAVLVPTIYGAGTRTNEYWAIFGYNGSDPFMENDLEFLNGIGGVGGDPTWRYTPWPSALRITVHLLDRNNRLGAGWTYQFVVDLPERN